MGIGKRTARLDRSPDVVDFIAKLLSARAADPDFDC